MTSLTVIVQLQQPLVEKQQGVDQSWAQVENQYQRRADLIPNLSTQSREGYSHPTRRKLS